jgi:formate hydrogenlyase subunit 3/multisubunit Na+/H+ antiporter MnhD subunit
LHDASDASRDRNHVNELRRCVGADRRGSGAQGSRALKEAGGVMFNTNMLNITLGLAIGVLLLAAFVFSWELQNRRIIPPFRVERAKRPRWYWLCIVTHAALLGFAGLVCAALALAIFFNNFFN